MVEHVVPNLTDDDINALIRAAFEATRIAALIVGTPRGIVTAKVR